MLVFVAVTIVERCVSEQAYDREQTDDQDPSVTHAYPMIMEGSGLGVDYGDLLIFADDQSATVFTDNAQALDAFGGLPNFCGVPDNDVGQKRDPVATGLCRDRGAIVLVPKTFGVMLKAENRSGGLQSDELVIDSRLHSQGAQEQDRDDEGDDTRHDKG